MAEASRARSNGLRALKTVKKVLADVGWKPEATGIEGVLRIDFSTDNTPVADAIADVRIEYERFLYYLNFRDRAPPARRTQTMEFVTRANYDLVIGNFEFNLDDGSVRFKSSIDFTGTDLGPALVRDAIRSATDVVELYADALVAVVRGQMSAVKALQEAESGIDER
jgi:hypothetical protein